MKVKIKYTDDGTYIIPEDMEAVFDTSLTYVNNAVESGFNVDDMFRDFYEYYKAYNVEGKLEDINFELSQEEFEKVCPNVKPKTHNIVVKGKNIERDSNKISFTEVVELAGKYANYYPTVTYSYANESKSQGILFWHNGVHTKEGTRFSVCYTGNA
jgi:hypothetical protein